MTTTLSRRNFISLIKKSNKKFKIIMEDREKLGYRNYGVLNHAEFVEYMNPHDNCLWDIIIPGYSYKITPKIHYIDNIVGYIWVANGNHKIIVKLDYPQFSQLQFAEEIIQFILTYSRLNKIKTKLVIF